MYVYCYKDENACTGSKIKGNDTLWERYNNLCKTIYDERFSLKYFIFLHINTINKQNKFPLKY